MRIFFSVGEPSGDEHTAQLINELQKQAPNLQAAGFGGERMQQAGCKLDFKLTDLAVMGFAKVVPHLAKFYRVAQQARRIFQTDRPDAVVLVDFPGFNWHIARYAKQLGIPVFYYLPPQIWAWASWRVERVRKYVDHVLCALPFEPQWYAERGIQAEYVGHPALEAFDRKPLDPDFPQLYSGQSVVGILPGSRTQEVTSNWPVQLNVISRLHDRCPDVRFAVACYKQAHLELCQRLYHQHGQSLPVDFHIGKTSEIIDRASLCLMVSGSVSLELLARGTPGIVMYRPSWFLYWFGLRVIQCNYMSLPNIFGERFVMPEFTVVGNPAIPTRQIADTIRWWLEDETELQRRAEAMSNIRDSAKVENAIGRAATAILQRLPQEVLAKAA